MTFHTARPRLPADNPALFRDCDADSATLRPLVDVLADATLGWSPEPQIRERARLMFIHVRAGNHNRAEEYAVEIEALMRADDARVLGKVSAFRDWPVGLGIEDWAMSILKGATRMSRRIHPDAAAARAAANTFLPGRAA